MQFRFLEINNITEIFNNLDSELESEVHLASESEISYEVDYDPIQNY
jgi:hypothetical protein